MFTKEDFELPEDNDFFEFLLIIPFILFIGPFVGAAYKLGFLQNVLGGMDNG